MIIKHGTLFICMGSSFSYGPWTFSNVTLSENNSLKIDALKNTKAENSPKVYHLSPEWFIITPRPTTAPNCPPLPENNKQDGLFALTQPSEITIWFLASSKYERNLWIEKILPFITLKPPTPPDPPPPYSEYDNLSYFPWDNTARTEPIGSTHHSSFTLPRPSIHNRSGFYSLEKPIKKPPKPVDPLPKAPEPSLPSEPTTTVREETADSLKCVNCCTLACSCICNTLTMCLHMCCSNFSAAL